MTETKSSTRRCLSFFFLLLVLGELTNSSSAFSTSGFSSSVGQYRSTAKIRYPSVLWESRGISDDGSSEAKESEAENNGSKASKREMLTFAIPALGIFLANPLLSNIDNAFVGRTVGTAGLAALSPATICTDQMLYLFSFLSRATTGIVSRAYGAKEDGQGDVSAAQKAGSAPFTVSIVSGLCLSVVYALYTPNMLAALNVDPILRVASSSYIYWRGAIAWAALAQSVALSVLLATRDAITPLKIVTMAAVVNILGDAGMCVWPLQAGCAGAAAATSFATLFSSGFMLKVLAEKKLLPKIAVPTKAEMKGLLEYMGPLLAITITRLVGFLAMQKAAMRLGVQSLAAYQICINTMIFFLLFGEPLSQISQTKLPALIDAEDGESVLATLKSVLSLAGFTALGVGLLPYLFLTFGSSAFSADPAVQLLTSQTAPAIFMAVATAIMTVAIDGAMLASKDFGFILLFGTTTCLIQLNLLPLCQSLTAVFGTFTFRLGSYAIAAAGRAALGQGNLGRIIAKFRKRKERKSPGMAM